MVTAAPSFEAASEAREPQAPKASGLDRALGLPAVFACVLATFVFFCVPHNIADPDIWWHLRDAQVLLTTHHFITHDLFSWTAAGAPWINHEWLSDLPYYAGWKLARAQGVYVVALLTIEAIMLGLYALAWRRSRNLVASLLITAIASILSTVSYGPRALLFGWLLLVAELAILELSEEHPKLTWLLPPLFLVWVNTHGSWLIGIVLLAVYIATGAVKFQMGSLASPGFTPKRLRSLLTVSGLSFAALFVNPYGWRLVTYPFNLAYAQKLNIQNVQEWHTLDFQSPRGKITLASLLILAAWQLVRAREWKLQEVAFLAIGIYSGFCYSRFLFLLAILAAPIAAASFAQTEPQPRRAARPALHAAILLVLVAMIFGRLKHPTTADKRDAADFPSQRALQALSVIPPGQHLFNEYTWGGYLEWYRPSLPVFIDPRADIFVYNGTFKDYLDTIHLNDSLHLLDKYGVNYVFYEANAPLTYLLLHTGGWKTDFREGNVILLERKH